MAYWQWSATMLYVLCMLSKCVPEVRLGTICHWHAAGVNLMKHITFKAPSADVLCMLSSACRNMYTSEIKGAFGSNQQWFMMRPVDTQEVLKYWESVWWSWPAAVGDPRSVGSVIQSYCMRVDLGTRMQTSVLGCPGIYHRQLYMCIQDA